MIEQTCKYTQNYVKMQIMAIILINVRVWFRQRTRSLEYQQSLLLIYKHRLEDRNTGTTQA